MPKKIVIVGGVAGGATAAARLRRLDETSTIVLFERGEHISFANCGLPYYIGETIKDRKKLLVQTVEGMSKKFNLDIRNLTEVVEINREKKTISAKNLLTNKVYEESYDTLILSPGAKPIVPNIEGLSEAKNVFTLRNIPDTDRIKSFVDEQHPGRAVVIGGGFIGLEMAENLVERGISVTVVELGKQVMTPIDYEMASIVHSHLRDKGVDLILEDGVKAFKSNGSTIELASGKKICTDMAILSIGVSPENKLAIMAGLDVGERGGIQVNEFLQTNDSNIFALGDAIEVKDYINGNAAMIPLAGPANRQGRIVANNVYGKNEKYKGTLGTAIAKIFDLAVAATGLNEKQLKQLGKKYQAVHIHPSSHAGYYPGAAPIALKLLFNPDSGTIYGAQAVGEDGVDKRIDVIATAIKGNLTVYDLTEIELSYAPPFSSAKDPVNMAGYVASNMMEGDVSTVQWDEIDEIAENGGLLIDVREPIEREMGFIKGSINIPLGEIRDRLDEIPKDKTIYVSCQVGLRGYLASRILSENGYDVKNLDGGWKTYSSVYNQKGSKVSPATTEDFEVFMHIDATGLSCPGPIMEVHKNIKKLQLGEVLQITSTDCNFVKDISAWCEKNQHTLVKTEREDKHYTTTIKKGLI
ncbi:MULTISPECIES: CoA-disulfide reductase [unclassified Bacillus (in: firmicutes)]|uniref:CoA-disulfide reductase n=1 Tax=unclassified Bacillus (in: firmicutes) TaxID=185979 RepID=UPI0008E49A8F|nr:MULTISPECIES: CoA-disulfide reductase [unclassified Bacillus (in: firmicutes)]SFA77975.1 CoA-disulfide reductase [Bacillus sp. UNCCL13]SFQ67863.1 CoA-disulfide reductase [Bacillus sp. cl95]